MHPRAATEFLERNRDTFFGDLARAVATSSNTFVSGLLAEGEVQSLSDVARQGTGRSFHTVAERFSHSLSGLLDELSRTGAGFVRCIKPNPSLAPDSFSASMVLQQLRTCGMVQAVRMMMAMYGARIPYTDIAAGWGSGSDLPPPLATLSPKELVLHMCTLFDVPTSEYALGKTRLFFRAGQVRPDTPPRPHAPHIACCARHQPLHGPLLIWPRPHLAWP